MTWFPLSNWRFPIVLFISLFGWSSVAHGSTDTCTSLNTEIESSLLNIASEAKSSDVSDKIITVLIKIKNIKFPSKSPCIIKEKNIELSKTLLNSEYLSTAGWASRLIAEFGAEAKVALPDIKKLLERAQKEEERDVLYWRNDHPVSEIIKASINIIESEAEPR